MGRFNDPDNVYGRIKTPITPHLEQEGVLLGIQGLRSEVMTAVVPDDFIRLKYRQPLHEPQLDDVVENRSLSMAKKQKEKKADLSEEMKAMRFRPAIMLPAHTQNTRVEKIIHSDDVQYRKDHKPTLFERVEVTKQLMKKTLRDEKRRADIQRRKNEERQQLAREAMEEKRGDMDDDGGDDDDVARSVASSADLEKQQQDEKQEFHELNEVELMQMDEEEIVEYKRAQLEEKERRIMRERDSVPHHYEVDKWRRRKIALGCVFGAMGRSKGVCEILPWIELGAEKEVSNQMHLMMRNVTHILNCTEDMQNIFPQQFVYLKVPVKDSEHDNLEPHFPSVLSFFERVEGKRGKIAVHCNSGACRAPAFIIAYLVAKRGIALADAYDYMRARRPVTQLNFHFMFELAKLELSMGEGCSVLYHKEWRFFEFNNIKADIDPKTDFRESKGLFATASELYSKRDTDHDHF